MEISSLCLATSRRNEIGDLLRGIVDLDRYGDPDPPRSWQSGVPLVEIIRELQGGRSGAAVYEMAVHRPGRAAQGHILKVGPLAEVAAEWRAYREWLAEKQSAPVTPVVAVSRAVSGPTVPGRLGAIVYQHVATYAGRSSAPVSTLEETVRGAIEGTIPLDDTLAIIRALIEQLDETVWQPWSGSQPHTLTGLNAWLGPDLVLEVDRAADASTLTFQAPTQEQRREKLRFSGDVLELASLVTPPRSSHESIELDTTVELRDLSTSAGPDGHLQASFGDTTIEIRRASGAEPHFQLLDYANHPSLTVVGRVVALRGRAWWSKIQSAVETADHDEAGAIVIDGASLADPFAALPARLTEFENERTATVIHGDLNPRNVLLVDRQVFLIDFARTGVGPPLSDVAWLELYLLRDVVAPGLAWLDLVRLQRQLALRARVADAAKDLPEPDGRAAAVLWEVRAGARRAHQRRGTTIPWWREYQDQLLIAALRTLKWGNQPPSAVYAAMAVAGVAAEQLECRPYRHWPADEILSAATAVMPLLNPERTESLGIASELVVAIDSSGLTGERFGTVLTAWRDAYVVARHTESAAVVLAQLAADHDLYISLQAFIRLKGQLQAGGFSYWEGRPFAETSFEYWPTANALDVVPGRSRLDYPAALRSPNLNGLPFEISDEADREELKETPQPAETRPAWAAVGIKEPDAIDLVLSEWAVVVLGDAGSGKSTVARELQYQLARAVMSAAGRMPSSDETETPDPRRTMPKLLPVTLRAPLLSRTLSAAPDDVPTSDFAESLELILQDVLQQPVPVALLQVGAVHLTIDAFNEIGPQGRERIAHWIHWLRRTYARVPIVICHRRNGYNPNELPFPVVVLQSVSLEQARDYIRTALRLRKLPDHETRAATLIRLLLDQPANPTIRDFARVPLYLWMITARYAQHGVVPGNVGELFADFSQWYLTERDGDDETPRRYGYDDQVRCLEVIARYLVESGNVTDITVEQAAELLANAELSDASQRLEDLVAVDMLDRDGTELRFHHQSFQEYFAARVLYREVGDLAALRDHVLEFRWREPLQMMLSFSGGDPVLTRRLIEIALRAAPKFAASLLRWTEHPPPEASHRFLAAQAKALSAPNLGVFEWERAADALVELGTEDARTILLETVNGQSLPIQARAAALSALLSMRTSNRFEDVRETLTRDLTVAITTILQSSAPASLRTQAVKAASSARLMPLAAYLVTLIDRDEAWQVARAAWNSLRGLEQVVAPAVKRRYVAMCAERLLACRAELRAVSRREDAEELHEECLELIEVLANAGEIGAVLAHRFSYGLADSFPWQYLLERESLPESVGQPLRGILAGDLSPAELIALFRGDAQLEVAAAAHVIIDTGDSKQIDSLIASVSASSSPTQLLAAASAIEVAAADYAPILPVVRELIGRLPCERYLEATVALVSCLPADEPECARLRLLAIQTVASFDHELHERVVTRWPCNELLYSARSEDYHYLASELMLSGDEGVSLATQILSSTWWVDASEPNQPALTVDAKERLLTHATSTLAAGLGKPDWRISRTLNACAVERLVTMIPLMIKATLQPGNLATEVVRMHKEYGDETVIFGSELLIYIGFLGRVAYEEDKHSLAERAHSFLTTVGPQVHHSMERARLVGLAILGDWVGLLSGLRPGDRRMLASAKNAIQVWLEGAPYTPAWATDLQAVGTWIALHLAHKNLELAPDVRSALSEIKDRIEQEIGRSIAPADAT